MMSGCSPNARPTGTSERLADLFAPIATHRTAVHAAHVPFRRARSLTARIPTKLGTTKSGG